VKIASKCKPSEYSRIDVCARLAVSGKLPKLGSLLKSNVSRYSEFLLSGLQVLSDLSLKVFRRGDMNI
jgi:hypothetical protein